jgi:hypothetical protein
MGRLALTRDWMSHPDHHHIGITLTSVGVGGVGLGRAEEHGRLTFPDCREYLHARAFRAQHVRNVDRSLSPRRSHRHGPCARVLSGPTRDECGPRQRISGESLDGALDSARAQQGRVVGGRPCGVTAMSWRRAGLIRRRRRRSDRVRRSLCRRRSRKTPC